MINTEDLPVAMERLAQFNAYDKDHKLVETLTVTRVTERSGKVEVSVMSHNPSHPNSYTQSWRYADAYEAMQHALVRLGWGVLEYVGKDEEG